ncbi:MAG: ribonuclease H-like domain-containing protein [Pirellulales bacterium]
MAAELPHATLLLDLETCGFAGSAIFLIGLVHYVRDRLSVDLLLARNYAEEPAILVTLRAAIASCRCLVTFNGKSFDWPMVRDRSILHRLDPDRWPVRNHCDLLHHARRRWKKVLPNCRLQTLETDVCGRHRTDDLPGSAIPEVYHDYVRSGRTDRLAGILHHNGLDLVTLLDLALRMTRGG